MIEKPVSLLPVHTAPSGSSLFTSPRNDNHLRQNNRYGYTERRYPGVSHQRTAIGSSLSSDYNGGTSLVNHRKTKT